MCNRKVAARTQSRVLPLTPQRHLLSCCSRSLTLCAVRKTMSREVHANAAPRLNLRGIITAVPAQHFGLHRDRWAAPVPTTSTAANSNGSSSSSSSNCGSGSGPASRIMHGSVRERARAYEQRYNGSSNGRAIESGAKTVVTSVKASTATARTDPALTEGPGNVAAVRMSAGESSCLSPA